MNPYGLGGGGDGEATKPYGFEEEKKYFCLSSQRNQKTPKT